MNVKKLYLTYRQIAGLGKLVKINILYRIEMVVLGYLQLPGPFGKSLNYQQNYTIRSLVTIM